jgi:hypothetical protein
MTIVCVLLLQYLIPMLGMLLGNACSGVAVGLSTILDEMSSGKHGFLLTQAQQHALYLVCAFSSALPTRSPAQRLPWSPRFWLHNPSWLPVSIH